jgi:hypothetical protein
MNLAGAKMTMANDMRDPVQKLKDLHDWLLNNKPAAQFPQKAQPVVNSWPVHNERAAAEVADFQNWILELNK